MSVKSVNSQFPKVTICVPVRNGASTIGRTLDSLLNQDYPNYEVIVSDNCSDDDTAKIVSQYASRDVKYFFNPVLEKVGAEGNWNYILALAEGPFIALYHADDIYTPTMVRRQVEFLETNPDVSAAFTMMQMIDEKDNPIRMGSLCLPEELRGQNRFEFPEYFNAVLKYCTFTPVPTMMTRRKVLDAVGYFCWQRFASAADVDLYLRMASHCGPIGVIDEPLHYYRISSLQGTAVINKGRTELPDFYRVMEAYLSDPEKRKVVQPPSFAFYEMYRAADQVICAMNLLGKGNIAEARKCLRESLSWCHFITGFRRPRSLARLLAGLGLLVSINLGLGTFTGRQVSRVYAYRNAWRRKPLK